MSGQRYLAGGAYPSMSIGSATPPSSSTKMNNCNNAMSLMEEWKAKEAAVNRHRVASESALTYVLEQQAKLRERLLSLDGKDSRWWPERTAIQNQLHLLEQQVRMMSFNRNTEDDTGKKDQFGKFFAALTEYMERFPGRTCLFSQVKVEPSIVREWNELVRSRIVRKSTDMKDVLKERKHVVEFYVDGEARQAVRFAGEKSSTSDQPSTLAPVNPAAQMPMFAGGMPQCPTWGIAATQPGCYGAATGVAGNPMLMGAPQMGSMSALGPSATPVGVFGGSAGSSMPVQPLAVQPMTHVALLAAAAPGAPMPAVLLYPPLTPEQVAAVEALLLKAGGFERFRRICLECNVQEQQLARSFRLYEQQGKQMVTHMNTELGRLEAMLFSLTASRTSLCEVMAFCMDHAPQHAAVLAKDLIMSLEVPDISSDMSLARFFLVSDVLFNSNCGAKGAGRYRAVFEELLPDACDRLGRSWLPKLEHDGPERERAESALRNVFAAWRTWDVFPSSYVMGLESLLLAPAPDPSTVASGQAAAPESLETDDAVLSRKLAGWRGPDEVGPAEAKTAARRRGLAGDSQLPVAVCRLRLCHYERYWHLVAASEAEAQARLAQKAESEVDVDMHSVDGEPLSDDDIDGEPVGHDELFLQTGRSMASLQWPQGLGAASQAPEGLSPQVVSGRCMLEGEDCKDEGSRPPLEEVD